ncbi:MAG: PDDEXK nuclease domain-containing protein [Verrucomicrobiota bacterium]
MKSNQRRSSQASREGIAVRIRGIWEGAQAQASRSVNTAHVIANWLIGKEIVEEQQAGLERARYGDQLMKKLSEELQNSLGEGFSLPSLKRMRAFFLGYPELLPGGETSGNATKGSAVRSLSTVSELGWRPGRLHTSLSWLHYRTLLAVDRPARDFYEIEAIKCNWNGRQLERQINSLLYERLAKSRDKAGVLALANEGHVVSKPLDLMREPFVLEFLNLPEAHQLTETEVETKLIGQLQEFLLELGEGFAFIGRQRRLTLEGDHFFPDLVFYHIRLRCYVIIDLKLKKLDHGDLGQMLLYVNYYDKEVRLPDDQPTVGLILCADKNETVARYVLGEMRERIFATRYQPHLPSVEQLEAELRRERERIEDIASIPRVAAVKKALSRRKKTNKH